MKVTVTCPYCKEEAELISSEDVYGIDYGMMWICRPCDATVGTHSNSSDHKPLGRLANKELRAWKVHAHEVFDPLWWAKMRQTGCSKYEARSAAYHWLAEQLGLPIEKCHIGMFDVEMCRRVVEVCKPYSRKG